MRLKDKVILVTGANSGIGKAIADRFAAEGAHVGVNYRPGGKGEASTADILKSFPVEGLAIAADVSKRDQVEKGVADLVAKFGRLDGIVCNAGIEKQVAFLDMTDADWHAVLDVNLTGSFLCAQVAARQMVKQGQGGRIIFTSSIHEDVPFPKYASYCASKGGIRMLMRNLCVELSPHKILCNNIAPGAIATPINDKTLKDPEAKAAAVEPIPLGRFGTSVEVAELAVYLASDESSYTTGATIVIDGGLTQNVTKY